MSQGFRYCTADAFSMVIVSCHHTEGGAAKVVRDNTNLGLAVFKFPRPWAIAAGDLLPNSAVQVVGALTQPRKTRKRIGE